MMLEKLSQSFLNLLFVSSGCCLSGSILISAKYDWSALIVGLDGRIRWLRSERSFYKLSLFLMDHLQQPVVRSLQQNDHFSLEE